jgi:polysaccharide export outer membrane protein
LAASLRDGRAFLTASLFLLACGTPAAPIDPIAQPRDPDCPIVEIGSVLRITVYKNPDLGVDAEVVRADGTISAPLVGDLPAVGRSLCELEADLVRAYSEYVKSASVSLQLIRLRDRDIRILEELLSPMPGTQPSHPSPPDRVDRS